MRKLPVLLAVLSMTFILSACAGKAETTPTKSGDASPSVSETQAELSYTAAFTELGGMENFLTFRCAGEEGFYATAAVMTSNTIPAGVTPEYETQYYNYEQRLYYVNLNGTVSRLRGYKPLTVESGLENVSGYSQSHTVAAMLLNEAGELISIEYVDESWYKKIVSAAGKESLGDYIIRQRWFIRSLSDSGAELSCQEIKLKEWETLNGRSPVSDGSGGIILMDSQGLRCVGPEGDTLWSIAVTEAVGSLVRLGDGSIYALSWSGVWNARRLDISARSLGESVELPGEALSVFAGRGGELYYNASNRLWGFDMDTGESREIVKWLDCDIIMENIAGLAMAENGDIAGIMTRYDRGSGGYLTELFTLSVSKEAAPRQDSLSLGLLSLDTELRNLVIDSNRAGNKRIDIVDYSGFEDPAGALTADIESGEGPDIICLDGLDLRALAGKGLLEDLYPYIEADGELSREDYFPNFLSACEYDGALVSASPGFTLSTVIGPKSATGSSPGWTLEQFDQAARTMDADCSILEYYSTRDDVLSACLALSFTQLVDTAAGSCDFENEIFRDILRFSSYFPASYDWNNFSGEAEDSTYYRLREGRQMLTQVTVSSPEDIFFCDACFDGGACFIGLPVAEGSGNALAAAPGYAISAGSHSKEEAWSFVRTFLTEDYQRGYTGIAGLSELFDEKLSAAMEINYYTDAAGETLTDEDGLPLAKPRQSFGDKDREGDVVQDFYAVTQQQADTLRALIDSTAIAPVYNEAILQLVKDKTSAYFAGTISAETASQAVQRAVSEYLAAK